MTKKQEKAIKNIETLSEYGLCYTITEKIQEDMKIILDMLKEQEKQISDLKEENLHWRGQYHLLSRKINVIPVKKVEDVLQKNKNELFSTTYVDPIQYKPFEMQVERINKIEKELLED